MKITKNKNKYFSYLQKQFSKFAVVLVVVSMLFGTLSINQTSAYFSDSASITGNTFTAGTLAFHLNPSTDFTSSTLAKGGTASYSTTLANDGSLGFQYTVETTNLNTDVDLCNALTLQATNGAYIYNDTLAGFSAPARSYDTSVWNFIVTLPSGVADTLQDKTCNFKFTFKGWQKELLSTQGFSDTKQINGTISSGHWVAPSIPDVVLNEILPDPNTSAVPPANVEFIELYNNSNASIDLAGWQVSEISGATEQKYTITTATTGSYRAVPYNSSTTISPKGFITLQLSTVNALNNTGDTIRLYNASGTLLDSYSYTTSTKGKSDARNTDGTGIWVDPIPTPGEANIMEEEIVPVVEKTVVIEVVKSDTTTKIEDTIAPEGVTEIPEKIEALIEITEPEIIETVEPVVTELAPVISETEPILEPAPVVEAPAVEALAPAVEVEAPAGE